MKQEDVDGVIDFATQTFGQLDILVNNAGIMDNFTLVGNLTDAEYERVMAMNLTGPVKLCRVAIQVMENKKPAGSSLITPQLVASSGLGVGRLTPWLNTLWWG